jgi:NADP-dependent 3-hydroxy acid dehydrogenase YdfG
MANSKIAVITGAGSGIGRDSALVLLEDGWTVVLAGRRKNMLEETAKFGNAPARTLVVPTDVSDRASIAALFDAVKKTYGRIDLLFNDEVSRSRTRALNVADLAGSLSSPASESMKSVRS